MKTHLALAALAFAAVAAPAVPTLAQSVQEFQLPPNPTPSATQRPEVQGPVDDSGVVPVGPRVIPTSTPNTAATPSAQPNPAPLPTSTGSPTPRPLATGRPAAAATQPALQRRAAPQPGASAAPTVPADLPQNLPLPVPGASEALPTGLPSVSPTDPAVQSERAVVAVDTDNPFDWTWALAVLVALILLASGILFWRRRSDAAKLATVLPARVGESSLAEATPLDNLAGLKVQLEAVRISRSVMNSTLVYRIELSNRSATGLRDLSVAGDMISAHGSIPMAQQQAEAGTGLPVLQSVDYIGPGQRKSLTGDMRLPLNQVRIIRQGKVPIYIPLVRLRVSSQGAEPRIFTFVVGKQPATEGARLQPFRLDTPPQTFAELGARALV
ncbi:hypothetical protein OAS19_02215 [Altererythrobacter sp.]|nr:hypothetical protein [Altererythrobacter sp.]